MSPINKLKTALNAPTEGRTPRKPTDPHQNTIKRKQQIGSNLLIHTQKANTFPLRFFSFPFLTIQIVRSPTSLLLQAALIANVQMLNVSIVYINGTDFKMTLTPSNQWILFVVDEAQE